MATKDNPGEFDCYARAAPDEPMFVLLARDPVAPFLVHLWVQARRHLDKLDPGQGEEAGRCAQDMLHWASLKDRYSPDVVDALDQWLDGLTAQYSRLALSLASLKSKLDEVWGIDNLVDINVEEPGDYELVLDELIALARQTKTEKT